MHGTIVSLKRGRNTSNPRQVVVSFPASANPGGELVGKRVQYSCRNKVLVGKITALHGKEGHVLASFRVGLPGQAIGAKILLLSAGEDSAEN
ncbi:MAG: 50S ribosomal protein L35ae [Candidatus Diapherotrites archaeon]|nr:50S ribosomal protein L35ae [Candidatus Diapherotrites archaeon]